jgi:hypothetical protein
MFAVGGFHHGVDIEIEIARAPAIEEHDGGEGEARQAVEMIVERPLHKADQQQRQAQADEDAVTRPMEPGGGKFRPQALEPLAEPAVLPHLRQLRRRMAEHQGKDDGDQDSGHARRSRECLARF